MTEPVQHETDTCKKCGQSDDHPKFHLIAPGPEGLAWETHHHDCAAELGHATASVVVQHAQGAKGDELRAILSDPNHPVHEAVAQIGASE